MKNGTEEIITFQYYKKDDNINSHIRLYWSMDKCTVRNVSG